MRIRILFFGQLTDIVGQREEVMELSSGARLSDVLNGYGARFPQFKALAPSLACSVNQEYAQSTALLQDGDEVGLLPPVSGGSGALFESPHCAIVQERIPSQQIAESLKAPEDGAVVLFEGIVRNHTRNRRTLYLDYEAYNPMAINEMEKLCHAALQQFAVRDLRVVHRLGRLEIGETSVLIVVVSAHRAAAFEACRWLIDTLKKTVPIWKKEYFEDGAVWSDGEAFPEEIRSSK
ncbi:MAG TPA: molybdenum cofactor biosynthesis protein MoaE [Candidatus Angelobacter sp.]|nr:molybdenum cofactor biosynthesis protein MoaE [Candidatus Angelobacter sp.]